MQSAKNLNWFAALKRGVVAGLCVFALYRAALLCGIVADSLDTFATPWPVLAQHCGLELICVCFFMFVVFVCCRRYAAVYATFLALELTTAFLCRMRVGVYEFLCLGAYPAVYALAAYLAPGGGSAGKRVLRALLWLFVFFGVLQYGIYIAYILRFGGRISSTAIIAAFSTNPEEAYSFLSDQFGAGYIALAAILAFGALAAARMLMRPQAARQTVAGWAFFVLAAAIAFGHRSKAECYSTLINDVKHAFSQYRLTREVLSSPIADRGTEAVRLRVSKRGTGEVCLVVIGESANRAHLHCFGYDRPTTPWMSAAPVILFKNAYACMVHTDQALTTALSRMNTYAPEMRTDPGDALARVVNSLSLPELLRAAGVETYWYSSQDRIGMYGNFVTMQLAMHTDAQYFTRDETTVPNGAIMQFTSILHQDGELIAHLRSLLQRLDKDKNAVIFLHLIGSHWRYSKDAPADWPYLPRTAWVDQLEPVLRERVETYDRSISYTDWVLSQFAAEVERSPFKVGSMLYFSDHSEDVMGKRGHNYDSLSAPMTTIPAAFWCTKGYEQRWPETVAALRANSGKVFTNDLAFELICGITHVTFDGLDERFQFTSPRYGVTPDTARFWQGRMLKEVVPGLAETAKSE